MQVPGCSNIQGNTERMEGTASLNQHAVGSGAEKSYKLYTKRLEEDIYYNVMRFYSPRFNVNNLIAPIKLARDVPKPSAQPPKDKKKNSSYSSDGGQIREGLDFSRLAPYGNAIKNRQNLFRKMTRTYQMSHSEAIEAESRYKDKSMSKYPWKFSDFESSYYYTGTPDGNQDSTYVLLSKAVSTVHCVLCDTKFFQKGSDNEDAFNIIPVKGWYKFTPKPWYRKTADPKAEEAPSSQKSTQAAASSKQLKEQVDRHRVFL